MADELKRIEPTHGPYRGQHIDIPAKDADQAIKDRWARDPFAPVDPKAEPLEFDQEAHEKAEAAADKYARKMRGEEDPAGEQKPAEPKPAEKAESTSTSKRGSRSKE